MDSKFYQTQAKPFFWKRTSKTKKYNIRSLDLQGPFLAFPKEHVDKVKASLSLTKDVYSNTQLPGYADLARIDQEFFVFSCNPLYFPYLSLNNGPGHFDFYIHAKLSHRCKTIAMTETKYQLSKLGLLFDPELFLISAGDSGTGDIRQELQSFERDFERTNHHVVFSICSLPDHDELDFLSVHVELTLKYLQEDGNAVLELPGDGGLKEAELVYDCACSFREINLFKPITSNLFSKRRYLVCKGRKPQEQSRYFSADFVDWYNKTNDEIDFAIKEHYQRAYDLLEGKAVQIPDFNQTLIYAYSQLVK